MEIELEPRKYVVAVSGGVDSVVLLNLLHHKSICAEDKPPHEIINLVVAHFDHGIRGDSREDRVFVQGLANEYGLPFVFDEGKLGPDAGESAAREARYKFLRRVKEAEGADAIITAHHEDDLLETAILNLLRGTGRKGLSSLKSTDELFRPLLGVSKRELIGYAKTHGLEWREDPTNADIAYRRNYIRHKLLPRFSETDRRMLRRLIDTARSSNIKIDALAAELLESQNSVDELNRQWFISLPHMVSREVMAQWLRLHGAEFDKRGIERIVVAVKTFSNGKKVGVAGNYYIAVEIKKIRLTKKPNS